MKFRLAVALGELAFLIALLFFLSLSEVVFAHCSGLYWDEAVITWFTGGARWGSASVTTNTYQRWGAPYCYVRDRHLLYRWSNGEWSLVASRYWYDYDEDTGFDHVWEYHEHTFSISKSDNYKARMDGLRYANHSSLLPHYKDIDIITSFRH